MNDQHPTIDDAKALAYRYRQRAVIVIFFGGGKFGGSSYGMTRPLCRLAGAVLDGFMRLVNRGTLRIPPDLCGDGPAEAPPEPVAADDVPAELW